MMPPAMLWGQVQAAMQQGRLDVAQAGAEQILRAAPRHPGALYILGVICLQRRQMSEALRWLKNASQADQRNAIIWATLGYACFEIAAFRDAVEAFQKATRLDPGAHAAFHGLAKCLRRLGRQRESVNAVTRAIVLDPRNADYLNDRGLALMAIGELREALKDFEAALVLAPEFFGVLSNKSMALMALGNNVEALSAAREAIRLAPDFAEAWNHQGLAQFSLGDNAAALESFAQAIRLDTTNAAAHFNAAKVHATCCNYALASQEYRLCLAVAPNHAAAISDLGLTEAALGNHSLSLELYDRALCIAPDLIEAEFNKSLACLLLGRLEEGWRLWEARKRKKTPVGFKDFGLPLWTGAQGLSGRRILLHCEQGFGDTIQFIRYVPLVRAKGAHVALMVQPELAPLIRRVMPGVVLLDEAPADATLQCPLMSLPRAFGTTLENIPAAPAWLADTARRDVWRARLGAASKPRIGLAWRGSAGHGNDRNRSLGLRDIQPIIHDQAEWIGIQKGMPDADRQALASVAGLRVFDDEITDFEDTAALIAEMDLIISVDTSLVHLAGSMGRECWVMLPFNPDWRWLLDREDSPWYPGLRLFRQKRLGDWATVFQEIRAALTERFG